MARRRDPKPPGERSLAERAAGAGHDGLIYWKLGLAHAGDIGLLRYSFEGHPASRCRNIKVLRSALAQSRMERAKGIEPSYAAWEAAVLPLNYARGCAACARSD